MRTKIGPIRIEAFASRKYGWDFSVGPAQGLRTWLAIWWTRRIDCGVAIGSREVRHTFAQPADLEPSREFTDSDPYAEYRMDAADVGDF